MDTDIDELIELVKKNIAISEDTNDIIHSMRRTARWGTFFSLMWWAVIIGSSGMAYLYARPYITVLQDTYAKTKSTGQQVQSLEKQAKQFLNSIVPQSTLSTSTSQVQ